jgi:hypothetical protein
MKLELLCPLLFVSPFSRRKDFFFFPLSIVQTLHGNPKSRPQFSVSSDVSTGIKISITAIAVIAVIEIFIPEKC